MKRFSSFFNRSSLFAGLFLVFQSVAGFAAIEKRIVSLSGTLPNVPITSTGTMVIQDQWFPTMQAGGSLPCINNSATVNTILRYDDTHHTVNIKFDLVVTYTLYLYDNTGSLTPTSTLTGETLEINYDPAEGVTYKDKALRQYTNAYKAKLQITQITYTPGSGPGTNPTSFTCPTFCGFEDVYLDLEQVTDRSYYLSSTAPVVTTGYGFVPATTAPQGTNVLPLVWNYVQGAESYDVEWLFVDKPQGSSPALPFDLRNATRINTTDNHYEIPLNYPRGTIIFRVRALGAYSGSTSYVGPWSYAVAPGTLSSTLSSTESYNYDGINNSMNWSYSVAYAEDGKRMEGVQYMDGLGNARQSVGMNHTENKLVVSEPRYDYEGRAALAIMPTPFSNTGGIQYQADFNGSFDKTAFDKDANVTSPGALGSGDNANIFYSSANPYNTGINGYLPDGGGYPYVRTRYKTDGTNRVRSQSAAGPAHQLGTGRETKYAYGTPSSQDELDRMFGNEVGGKSHYKKNMVTDANGQTSLSYLDQEGRVIATALAGTGPANLLPVDGQPSAQSFHENLLTNNNALDQSEEMVSTTTILVTASTNYSFNYSLGGYCYTNTCTPVCTNCTYDLILSITDEDGNPVTLTETSPSTTTVTGPITATGITSTSGTYSYNVTLSPGSYTVSKIVQVHPDAGASRANYIADQYAAINTTSQCVTVPVINPESCTINCQTICTGTYFTGNYTSGSDSIYVNDSGVVIPDASRTTVAWGLLTACRASLCYPSVTQAPDECTLHLQLLTADMSPGGQYFDNTPGKYKYDSLNNAILDTTYNINLWMSTTSGISSTMLGTINSTYSTSYTTWDQVRANWIPAYGTTLVQYHPEYCLYKYYCVSRTCGVMGGVGGGASYDPTSINQYETSMYSTEDNSTASTDGFFNPAGVTLSTSHTPTNAYCPYSPSGSSPDPFYNCAANVACSEDAQQLMQGYLENYFWDPGTSAFYSIWYVLDDPDGIHLLTPDPTNILRTYIQNLLGTSTTSGLIGSGAGQVSKYNYFRSSYLFYRNLITFKQAPNCVSSGTTSGYTLRYPQDSVFISFNLCSPTTTASNLSTYSNNNMILSCESNCATYADGWIAQLSSCSLTSTQLSNIRANLISVCAANCDNPSLSTNNYNGTAGCSTCPGVNYPSTGTPLTVFHDFADVVSYFSSSSCTTTITFSPAAPSPPTVTYDQGICSCENLSNFINTYNLDPTHIAGTDMPTANLIAAMFAQASGAVTSYTGTQIQSWISDCAASTTTISMSTLTAASFPTLLTCPAPASTSTADIVAAAKVAECQQQNLQTSMDNSAQQFLANLKSLADKFVSKYDSVCLTNLSVAGTETFTMDHTELIFQYTLYYYDQAGNLIKTIPPKGFVPLTATQITNTQNYRAALSGSSFQYPAHTMVTDYMYNSLQQLIQQTTPDAGQTNFFYDEFGRLVASQNANQYVAGTYSYTLYDYLGRIAEVGQIATSTALTEAIAKDATVGAFASWIGGGTRSQVTSSYYDDYLGSTISDNTVYNYFSNCTSSSITTPGYLRNRVSSTTYKETYSSSIMTYDNASHYSYDQHGNVNVLLQETGELNASGNGLKRIEYAYDLVSGNVNQVHYSDLNCSTYNQKNFYHNYYYDLDNRLASVYTSLDNVLWDKDSKYFYYLTGALNRTELGDKQVQGLDYAYTINGWLKGVNSASMVSSADIGKDAYYSGSSNNLNANFGTDAMGFTLGYFKANSGATAPYGNDYTAVNTSFTSGTSNFEVNQGTGNAFAAAIVDLFNGNISNMVTGLMDQTQHLLNTQGKAYRYDQLNRIKSSTSFEDTGIPTSNTWTTTFGLTGAIWSEDFSYDFNGNLNQVNRKGNLTTLSGRNMDNFTYYYYTTSGAQITATATPSGSDQFTNKLAYVTDNTLNTPSYADDIDNESSSNYTYDKIGNLIGDVSEGIQEIDWTVYNKVKRVIRTAAANCNPDLEFRYDASGNRIVKIVKPHNTTTPYALTTQDQWTYTYYVHDAQGNVMSTYTKKYTVIGTNHFNEIYNLNELDIFGSSRLGLYEQDPTITQSRGVNISGYNTDGTFIVTSYDAAGSGPASTYLYTRTVARKVYETTNHLGNVLATVSDKKLGVDVDGISDANGVKHYEYYTADVLSFTDYYAFGAPMPGRNGVTSSGYRYGFNGMEKDDEWNGHTGAHYTTDFRQYDPRLGRWTSIDPLAELEADQNPYNSMDNNPISLTDPDGLSPGDWINKILHPHRQHQGATHAGRGGHHGLNAHHSLGKAWMGLVGDLRELLTGAKYSTRLVPRGGYVKGPWQTLANNRAITPGSADHYNLYGQDVGNNQLLWGSRDHIIKIHEDFGRGTNPFNFVFISVQGLRGLFGATPGYGGIFSGTTGTGFLPLWGLPSGPFVGFGGSKVFPLVNVALGGILAAGVGAPLFALSALMMPAGFVAGSLLGTANRLNPLFRNTTALKVSNFSNNTQVTYNLQVKIKRWDVFKLHGSLWWLFHTM